MRKWLNHSLSALLLPSVVTLLAAGCDDGEYGPQAIMAPDTPAQVGAVPWPSDALLGDDGKLQVSMPFPFDSGVRTNLEQLAATLSESDGFATTRSIFFPVTQDVVVADQAAATLVDLEDSDKRWSLPLFYRADSKQLVAQSPLGMVLKEHHQYGCFVLGGVHDAAGRSLEPSPTMYAAIQGRGAYGQRSSYRQLGQLLAKLKAHPIAATAFTTQTLSGWVPNVIADLESMPPTAVVTRVFDTPEALEALFGGPVTTTKPGYPMGGGGILHSDIARVIEGTYDSPNYLAPTPATLGIFDAAMTIKLVEQIPFILTLPARADYANLPVLIFQHGIGADRSQLLTVANDYARRGYATIGIDELWHGSRSPDAVDEVFNISGAPGQDGIGDPTNPILYFFDFNGDDTKGILPLDTRYMRDNFKQAAVDLMQLVRLVGRGDVSALRGAAPGLTFDKSKLVYTSESFGSILGAIVVAVDPELRSAVLDVGGGGVLIDLVPNSASFAQLLQPFVAGAFDTYVDVNHPDVLPVHAQMSLNMLQQAIEPGDGMALSLLTDPGKNILFLQAYNDETVPNQANEALALAFGATEVSLTSGSQPLSLVALPKAAAPYSSAAPLRAVVQMAEASHNMFTNQTGRHNYMPPLPPFIRLPAPVTFANPIERVHQLALDFIDGASAGAPVVTDVPASN
jgi:hypothetical protein